MQRSAPSSGYDFGNKRQYRRTIWKNFRDFTGTQTGNSHALLMPSAEGTEIDVALSRGFREQNLHVVDRNPAIVAHLKRRYPRVNTYGVALETAADRIAASGVRLSVANCDLCGTCDSGASELRRLNDSGALEPDAMIAVTMLRGRERSGLSWSQMVHNEQWMRGVMTIDDCQGWGESDAARIMVVANALRRRATHKDGCRVRRVAGGVYRSSAGSQSMMFQVFNVSELIVVAREEVSIPGIAGIGYFETLGRMKRVGYSPRVAQVRRDKIIAAMERD